MLESVSAQQGAGLVVAGQRNLGTADPPLQGTQALETGLATGCITSEAGGTNLRLAIQPVTDSITQVVASRNVNMIVFTVLAPGILFIRILQSS